MIKINIVWVGCHEEGVATFHSLLKIGCNITRFITLNDESFNKRSGSSREYIGFCKDYNVPISLVSSIKDDEAYEIIQDSHPDLMIVLGWSEILPEKLLDIPTIGTVGAHASFLPHGRGSAPVNWSIINGEEMGGNSLMWLDKEVDKGNIIDQIAFDITPYDTCKTVYEKVSETNRIMLLRLIDRLSNGLPTVMNKHNVTDEELLPRRRPKDGLLDWDRPSRKVYDFIRALARPYPGAFSFLEGKKYKIWSASLLPINKMEVENGTVVGPVICPTEDSCGWMVACSMGYVILHELEDEEGNVYKGKSLIDLHINGRFTNE